MTTTTRRYTLSLSCPDRVGIVAAVSNFLAAHSGWITEASQHTEHELSRFFMRVEIEAVRGGKTSLWANTAAAEWA